ncbi:thioredoxin family protein [Aureivirga marina]|uniref:thioredoxin family protein n=1 Tax=Aureivirga marina TaxID=1182451 RepID=UPI0018CBCFC0|nr:thioredoxin family protein [Aureivirga marina]
MSTEIKILHASCCSKTTKIKNQLEKIAKENQLEISIKELSDLKDIMVFGTMTFPSLVINDKVYDYKLYESDAKLISLLK